MKIKIRFEWRFEWRKLMVSVLIDFDNFFNNQTDDFNWLEIEFNELINQAFAINRKADFISFRLYGGWMENGLQTNIASKIQQAIASFKFFPLFNRSERIFVHGDIELATRLISLPDIEWDDTKRTHLGIPKLRLASAGLPKGCMGINETCPVRILYRFAGKRTKKCPVSGCHTTNKDAFKVVEQKMVDTMLSCDIISLSDDQNVEGIIVASDDFDLLPPIVMAVENGKKQSKQIVLLKRVSSFHDMIFDKLENMGLKIMWR